MLTQGSQDRPSYVLEMELWEAEMAGIPTHPAFRWATLNSLESGCERGSLCCALALKS